MAVTQLPAVQGVSVASRTSAVSSAVVVNRPAVDRPFHPGTPGSSPWAGLKPKRPQCAAGIRMLPPPSLAVATLTTPAATAAADPLLEPPARRETSAGLRAGPQGKRASGGMVVCPRTTMPAARNCATHGSSASATEVETSVPLAGAGSPATAWLSLTARGTPSSGRVSPAARAVSAAAASRRAASCLRRTNACNRWISPALARAAVTSAVADVVPAWRSSSSRASVTAAAARAESQDPAAVSRSPSPRRRLRRAA